MAKDLDEIREELASRRQGRWYIGNHAGGVWCHRDGEHSALDEQVCDCNPHDYRTYYEAHADAVFIANAPKRIATLLARIDELRAERDRLRADRETLLREMESIAATPQIQADQALEEACAVVNRFSQEEAPDGEG